MSEKNLHEYLYGVYSTLSDATTAASVGDPNTVAKKAAEAKRAVADIDEMYQPCDACGHPVNTLLPGVWKAPNDNYWWHPGCAEQTEHPRGVTVQEQA